ncbi:Bacitracin export ATP-binding protein BceA [Sporotomaculum syntrophicum]|uniref:Bacitracin export ATP-binding protein BceA n=1 Tax=Sporotomaculum syntrophicum TaxID=182264 RepID=A0A9D2WMG7_9FIRM|nr:AAA family ATPase [Sporotomaculum syntrophicum]KAF1083903.1 Bacitracin export ATP-binding protein BceA [Sporotomaculum syntrophicum]
MSFLKKITVHWERVAGKDTYPFNIPALKSLQELDTNYNVVFFIGENGTGKSTLLEAVAAKCGFGLLGGGKNFVFNEESSPTFEEILSLAWLPKVTSGFFLRAETFYDFACRLDQMAREDGGVVYAPYGGSSLNEQSHGEAFLALFNNRFNRQGLYILDEPEAALSPQRQFAFLRIINQLEQKGKAQFIMATHSPIIMAYPGAVIYSFDGARVSRINYEETEHYQLTKAFLNDRERFFMHLFAD